MSPLSHLKKEILSCGYYNCYLSQIESVILMRYVFAQSSAVIVYRRNM